MPSRSAQGLGWAALSGLLFGSINVAVKLDPIHPVLQSAVAYLAVALVLSPHLQGLRVAKADRARMLAMALVGGAVSPVLLFYGLREATAVDAGLLLTLELVVTTVLAVLLLGEREKTRGWLGLLLLVGAAAVAATAGSVEGATTWRGALLVAASAAGWGVDNILSTRLVGTYRPTQILVVKGLVGGLAALAFAAMVGAGIPHLSGLALAAGIGLFGLAASLFCFYMALQRVGAARTSALNIPLTALAGAAGGYFLLHESLNWAHGVALLLLVAGVCLFLRPQGSSIRPL